MHHSEATDSIAHALRLYGAAFRAFIDGTEPFAYQRLDRAFALLRLRLREELPGLKPSVDALGLAAQDLIAALEESGDGGPRFNQALAAHDALLAALQEALPERAAAALAD